MHLEWEELQSPAQEVQRRLFGLAVVHLEKCEPGLAVDGYEAVALLAAKRGKVEMIDVDEAGLVGLEFAAPIFTARKQPGYS